MEKINTLSNKPSLFFIFATGTLNKNLIQTHFFWWLDRFVWQLSILEWYSTIYILPIIQLKVAS